MKFKQRKGKVPGFKHQNSTMGWLSREAHSHPKTWGYIEHQLNANSVETMFAWSAEDHGGKAYAYDKVKRLKNVLRAFHGVVKEDQLVVVEQYDPKSKRWEKPSH